MAVIDFPDGSKPDAESWALRYNTQSFSSELNGMTQTAELPGSRWVASVTYSSRMGREARELQAFFASLRGRVGRFWYTPTDWEPIGNPAGTAVVSINAPPGASIVTATGWTANRFELFVAGDYIEINGELKKITKTVNSNAGGAADLHIAPPLRLAATVGTAIRYSQPRCLMMLKDDQQASWSLSAPIIYAASFEFMEALDI